MTQPLVSILTPSFNQGAWLADNLGSVRSQTYSAVEQIVMDGGSTDGSLSVLQKAGPAVRWRSEPDNGQSNALNKAYRDSNGEIIGWLNSDDAYFHPGVIADAVETLERNPSVGVVYGHAALVNARGRVLQMMWVPPFSRGLLRLYNFIIQPTVFIRRACLGPYLADETYDYAMDKELWLRLSESVEFRRIPRVMAIDRHHPMRKAYTHVATLREDVKRLEATYSLPRGPSSSFATKGLKVAFRLLGVSLVGAMRQRLAFSAIRDPWFRTMIRQVLHRREMMPSDLET